MWDLIVSVPDHCLSFYFEAVSVGRPYPVAGTVAGLVRPEGMKMQSGIYHKFSFFSVFVCFCFLY